MEEPTLPMPGDAEPTPPALASASDASALASAPDASVATQPQEQDMVVPTSPVESDQDMVVVVVGVWW